MAHDNKVLRSIETDDGRHCVDIFCRPDGSLGFELYRRDAEAGGWFAIGHFGARAWPNEAETLKAAREAIPWLESRIT